MIRSASQIHFDALTTHPKLMTHLWRIRACTDKKHPRSSQSQLCVLIKEIKMSRTVHGILALIMVLGFTTLGEAQPSTITTYAGPALPRDGALASSQGFDQPLFVIPDSAGGFYFTSYAQSRVYRVAPNGLISLVAGSTFGFGGDGGPAREARFRGVAGIALDTAGNLYISDYHNHRVRKVTPAGVIETVAGTGSPGYSGDSGPATAAQLRFPNGIVIDPAGNLYIADELNNRVRKVNPSGEISTVAGTGTLGSSGDNGPATAAQLNQPVSVALDSSQNLFIAEYEGHRVRKISGGTITTVAGNGSEGFSGDGGLAVAARLSHPYGIAMDGDKNLYIADRSNHRIRKVAPPLGVITTFIGNGTPGYNGDGPALPGVQLNGPSGLALDSANNFYIADTYNHRIRKTTLAILRTVAGNGTMGFSGDPGSATAALLSSPTGVALDSGGNLFFVDTGNNRVRRITASGAIATVAGSGAQGSKGDGGSAVLAELNVPLGVAVDSAGAIYIADTQNNRVRKVLTNGVITTVAGSGSAGYSGDGGYATAAQLNLPAAIAVDKSGNLYIADALNHCIRKVDPSGIISTIAGIGTSRGYSGDGPGTSALLNLPLDVEVDPAGGLYIADSDNGLIRKLTPGGTIVTVAGRIGAGVPGINGDGHPATQSGVHLSDPVDITVDSYGNLFIAEFSTSRVRVVTNDGVIRTAVGIGLPIVIGAGFSGDGGAPDVAQLSFPRGVAISATGDLYITDEGNHRIRKVTNAAPPTPGSSLTISARGGASLTSAGEAADLTVGYGRIHSTDNALAGLAIFGYRQNNVLISEAAVPATRLIRAGRIYAQVGVDSAGDSEPKNTGLAIANPNDTPAEISFSFTGTSSASGVTTIPPYGQTAAFLDQAPFNGGGAFQGTFSFTSSAPVAVTALRGLINKRGDFLITTLPVADPTAVPTTGEIFMPHFAVGGGWTTEIILTNPTSSFIEGTVQFLDRLGNAANLTANGQTQSTFRYILPPREATRLKASGPAESTETGSVHVLPVGSSPSPIGVAIFSYQQAGVTVTEAGVPSSIAASAFRMYAETAGNFEQGAAGSIQSGIAVANLSSTPATVTLALDRLDGLPTGLTATLSVPGNGQLSTFLNQIPGFSGVPVPFQGVLRISSPTPISAVGLRGRYNERAEFLITTTAPVSEAVPPGSGNLFFPHFADSAGYTTQFILFGGSGESSSGRLRLVSQSGETLNLILR
jgi:sugar lactone lactonase YvrE